MTWYVIDMATTKHAISAEFSDAGFSWGVSERKHPVSLIQIVSMQSKADAQCLVRKMNSTPLTSHNSQQGE